MSTFCGHVVWLNPACDLAVLAISLNFSFLSRMTINDLKIRYQCFGFVRFYQKYLQLKDQERALRNSAHKKRSTESFLFSSISSEDEVRLRCMQHLDSKSRPTNFPAILHLWNVLA